MHKWYEKCLKDIIRNTQLIIDKKNIYVFLALRKIILFSSSCYDIDKNY